MLRRRALRARACRANAAPSVHLPITQRVSLGTGADALQIAPIVNGCWQLAGGHGREVFDNLEAKLAAHAAAGFTTFDTADIYRDSEALLGQFAAAWRAGGEGRPPLQLLTKYVPNIFQVKQTPAAVEAAILGSAGSLGVQRLDLVQLHWWDYAIPGMVDVGLTLADMQARGLIGHIGTTNLNVAALDQLLDAGVPLVSNQVQFSLLDRRPLNGMLQRCEAAGMKLLTYGSVGGGLLSDKHAQPPKKGLFGGDKHPPVDLSTSSLKMYMGVVKRLAPDGVALWRRLLGVLRSVAEKHGVSVAAVALRWVMQQGGAAGSVVPIVGVRGAEHVQDNATALALAVDQADLAAIAEVLGEANGPMGDCYSFEREG